MGSGIAQAAASKGLNVHMVDISDELVKKGFQNIRRPLESRVKRGKMKQEDVDALLAKIEGGTDIGAAASESDVIIEAVVEKMEIKSSVFAKIDDHAPEHAVLGSNTSSLSITEIASATERPDRVIGLHFFNPPAVMKLVEVIRGSETSDATCEDAFAFCELLGKTPVEVKETPGFVVNRMLVPMLNEAFYLLMEGAAEPEAIDTAMKLGTNMPMGPFELVDYIGLDVIQFVMDILFDETKDARFRPCPLLRKYVRAGRYGRKVGRGVYDYNK